MLAKWFPADYAKYKKNTPLLWRFKPKEVDDVGWLKIIAYPLLASITNKVFHVEIKGLENIPKSGGALIVPNHLSYPDPFFVGANIPRNIRYLTTAEVFRSPKNKFLLTQMGSIPIKRFTEDPAGLIKMFRFLRRGRVVGYFPEGMRSWDGSPSPFPNGVAKVLRKIHVPIIPVSVSGLYAVMPRWTNKWRRARLTITYHEPFVIEKNWTDAELENRLSDLLHREEIETEPVIYTTKHLIEGLTRLLWRCPICGSIKSLEEYLPNKMSCNSCHGRWTLQQNHMLCYADSQHTEQIDSKIAGWVKRMEKFPLPDFVEGETYYPLHNSECELARGNYPDFKVLDTGKFYLTREYLEFRGSAMTELWKLSDIKVISAEGNRKLQLTLPEYQLQFTMKNDSILMWDRILTKVTNA